jgi:vacuolar iron transporter family protein
MSRLPFYPESHLVNRIGWLRAAVLGASDGILSTASLVVGVASAAATQNAERCLNRGCRGTSGWTTSMAAGEYVSVSSQSDAEQPDLARERMELSDKPGFELNELADRNQFYRQHDDGGQAGCREILLRVLGDNGQHTRTPPEKGRR